MARPLRLEFEGALYHVTSRGDRQENIYEDDGDRKVFLKLMGQVCARFNWLCYAYCLMSNHYHLLVETPQANLSGGMRHLNGVYSQAYNRRHATVGHVFQGRYKAIVVDSDAYLLELTRYVVLNPVRASLVQDPVDWPWSSYRATFSATKTHTWLATDRLLSQFGTSRRQAEVACRRFVLAGVNAKSPWRNLRHQIYLGGDAFVDRMKSRIGPDSEELEIPKTQRRRCTRSLAELEVAHQNRRSAMRAAYVTGNFTLRQIADHFGVHYSTVSRAVKL